MDKPTPQPTGGEAGAPRTPTTLVTDGQPGPFSRGRVGEVLGGRYKLVRRLGAGGMGTVYLAEHVHLGRLTAVKLLLPALCADHTAEERFRREALLASKINHPAVAQIYDFDRTPEGGFFLAMEYVDGETLAQKLGRGGPLTVAAAAAVLHETASGIDHAHALRIVHRDIKPANLMLAAAGGVKILDFGVARPLDESTHISAHGLLVGTPAYMSPEQLAGHSVGPATDIYALGLVLYEMLSGKVPHAGSTYLELRARRTTERPPLVHAVRRECPAALSEVLGRALEPDPQRRWPSATAFAEAVDGSLGSDAAPIAVSPAAGAAELTHQRWEGHFEALRAAGREAERQVVEDACATAALGRVVVLWIEGEEGCGKSAFFEQALRDASARGALTLAGRGFKAEGTRPYSAWLSLLREALRQPDPPHVPAVLALTDVGSGQTEVDRATLCDQVATLLTRTAGRRPLLVGVEDLDTSDPASVALFDFVANQLADAPVALVATVQSESLRDREDLRDLRARLRGRDSTRWVTLRPLDREAVGTWLTSALGREAPEALLEYVYGNSEGNAFFIEQVMRELLEQERLDQITEQTARVALADLPPPVAVADILQRRLRDFGKAARDVLQVAAVVGRAFDVDLVIAITAQPEEAVLEVLDAAVAKGVLTPEHRVTGDWYRFTHRRIRDVLAGEINPRRRRRLHGQVAEALAGRPDTPAAERAWHWYHAGVVDKAFADALTAARDAMALHDYDDALTAAVMAGEVAHAPEQKLAAHGLRGDALRRLDRPDEARAAYADARRLGKAAGAADINLRRKELREALLAGAVTPAAAAAEARQLETTSAALSPTQRAAIDLLLSDASFAAGQYAEAERAAAEAEQEARAAGDEARVGEALLALGAAQLALGKPDPAACSAQGASGAFLGRDDSHGAARGYLLLADVALARGDRTAAHSAFGTARRLAEAAQVPRLLRQVQKRCQETGDDSQG